MRHTTRRLTAAAAVVLGIVGGGALGATAVGSPSNHHVGGSALAADLTRIDRSAAWREVSRLELTFPTYHPEGLVVAGNRIYLSSTQIIEPTVKYPKPVGGFDRTPGKGIGHLFVMNRRGQLLHDIVLGHGIVYHPGGIDFDGRNIWVPVAQYRPDSTAEIDRVDVRTLKVTRQFTVDDHIGGVVYDKTRHLLVANNWGSRTFYDFKRDGTTVKVWANPQDLIDFQDCQYVPAGKMACGGVTGLPQTPSAGGSTAAYELGGIALLDLRKHKLINAVPFQTFSAAGHVLTRNPLKLKATGRTLTMYAAPDNGEDVAGTQLFTFTTTLPR